MPSSGRPVFSTAGSALGAAASYTLDGPPESTMPFGSSASTSLNGAVHGSTTENTLNSRMRRAISWVYCEPKSRITIVEVSTSTV